MPWNNEGQCKIPHAATKTSCSQNKQINIEKGESLYGKFIFSNAMSLHRLLRPTVNSAQYSHHDLTALTGESLTSHAVSVRS